MQLNNILRARENQRGQKLKKLIGKNFDQAF